MRLTRIVTAALIVAGLHATGARADGEGIPDPRGPALEALRKESAVPPEVRFQGPILRFARIQVPVED